MYSQYGEGNKTPRIGWSYNRSFVSGFQSCFISYFVGDRLVLFTALRSLWNEKHLREQMCHGSTRTPRVGLWKQNFNVLCTFQSPLLILSRLKYFSNVTFFVLNYQLWEFVFFTSFRFVNFFFLVLEIVFVTSDRGEFRRFCLDMGIISSKQNILTSLNLILFL